MKTAFIVLGNFFQPSGLCMGFPNRCGEMGVPWHLYPRGSNASVRYFSGKFSKFSCTNHANLKEREQKMGGKTRVKRKHMWRK
jgi:hypothetical protein